MSGGSLPSSGGGWEARGLARPERGGGRSASPTVTASPSVAMETEAAAAAEGEGEGGFTSIVSKRSRRKRRAAAMDTAEPRPGKRPAFPPVAAEALGVRGAPGGDKWRPGRGAGIDPSAPAKPREAEQPLGSWKGVRFSAPPPPWLTLFFPPHPLGWQRRDEEGGRAGQQVHAVKRELDENIHACRGALAASNQV